MAMKFVLLISATLFIACAPKKGVREAQLANYCRMQTAWETECCGQISQETQNACSEYLH